MFELKFEETLLDLGFSVLSADSVEDIDKWPSFDSLFPIPSKYKISHYYDRYSEGDQHENILIVKDLEYEITIKLILLLQSDGYYDEEFVREFLNLKDYCCFMTLDGEYIAEKQ